MLTRALMTVLIGSSLTITTFAEPARTWVTGTSRSKAIYENVNTGPMRTTLTKENKFPNTGQVEIGGFYSHSETADLEQDSFGVFGRVGIAEFLTAGASVPFVNSEFTGSTETGIGDVNLSLDLLAYQDIFSYPFVVPHVDVTLPTGDEDKGLGSGDTVVKLGLSVGTKVYDALTYVVDVSYAFDGGNANAENKNIFIFSGSLVWDVSDRLALLVEGSFYEENKYDDIPYLVKGGLAYRISRDIQIAIYGGVMSDDTFVSTEDYDIADARLTVQF